MVDRTPHSLGREQLERIARRVPGARVRAFSSIDREHRATHCIGASWRIKGSAVRHELQWSDRTGMLVLVGAGASPTGGELAIELGVVDDRARLGSGLSGWQDANARDDCIEWLIGRMPGLLSGELDSSPVLVRSARDALSRRPRRVSSG